MDVAGQQVVLDDASVLGPVGADDGVVIGVHQLGPSLGFAALEVPGALGLDHRPGYAQGDDAVGGPTAAGELAVAVLDGDLVAEELRRAGAGVGDQGFVLRQFQLEVITQERREAVFDLLGLGLGSSEPEQVVSSRAGLHRPALAEPDLK